MNTQKYDNEKQSKAVSALVLRLIVAAYMGFLCCKLWSGSDALTFRIIGGFFLAAAVIFVVYSLKRLRIDLRAARTDNDSGEMS